jgi:hypothetical protein
MHAGSAGDTIVASQRNLDRVSAFLYVASQQCKIISTYSLIAAIGWTGQLCATAFDVSVCVFLRLQSQLRFYLRVWYP